jgi:hypothetical protein
MNLQFVCKTEMEPLNYIHTFMKSLLKLVNWCQVGTLILVGKSIIKSCIYTLSIVTTMTNMLKFIQVQNDT